MNEQEKIIGAFFDDCAAEGLMAEFDPEEKQRLSVCLDLWDIRPGDHILEPGCGTGRLTAVLADKVGNEGLVVACDISREMVARAVRRDLPAHVRFYYGSIDTVPVETTSCDKVICFQVFPHFSDSARALQTIRRVLKPGGLLWITHLASREEINNRHRYAGDVVISHQIPEENEIRKLLTDNGFTVQKIFDSPVCYWIRAERMRA